MGTNVLANFSWAIIRSPSQPYSNKLKGKKNVDEKSILQLDLMESVNGLPTNMQMISCSLEDLAENCKIITKERFRLLNMEEL